VHSATLGWARLRCPESLQRVGAVANGSALAMTARRRGRHGPPFGPGRGFGPFLGGPGGFPRGRRARRGDVREAALRLLAEGPLNGYQLMQEIERRSNGVWRPSPGSVYPALAQLEDEGLVRAEERGERRTYALTDAGRARVDERPPESPAPWEQMTDSDDGDRATLFLEMRRLGMAVGQIGHLGTAQEITRAREIVTKARRAIYALLAEDDDEETA
jgi:DNA-binding PadR family transcriptional regulator